MAKPLLKGASTIHGLPMLNYADQADWRQLIAIPLSKILITRDQGEGFILPQRDRPVG